MPRTNSPRTTPLGPYPSLPVSANALDLTMTAADTVNFNEIIFDGPMLLIVQNTDTVAQTFTLTSIADVRNRTGDITTYSLGADEIAVFKLDQTDGWKQTGDKFYLQGSAATIKFGAVRLG